MASYLYNETIKNAGPKQNPIRATQTRLYIVPSTLKDQHHKEKTPPYHEIRTTKMGMLWHDNLDPNNEVGSCQKIWVDNLDPFWLYHFSCPKNVWVDNFANEWHDIERGPTNLSNI